MATNQATRSQCKAVSDVANVAVSFSNELDSGELLTGTPTVAEVTTSDLTLTAAFVNTAELTINGITVPIGEAVQFGVSDGLVANSPYFIRITTTTDSTPAQTKVRQIELRIVAD